MENNEPLKCVGPKTVLLPWAPLNTGLVCIVYNNYKKHL